MFKLLFLDLAITVGISKTSKLYPALRTQLMICNISY
jgi:hypothetical protein